MTSEKVKKVQLKTRVQAEVRPWLNMVVKGGGGEMSFFFFFVEINATKYFH